MSSEDGSDRFGVLFVCLGNICRSPLAEAIFRHHAHQAGLAGRLDIDSAGTGHWHVGGKADSRSIEVGARHCVDVTSIARQVEPDDDFERFDLLIPMDESNKTTLIEWGARKERTPLMRSFDPGLVGKPDREIEVPDPYYGSGDGFQRVFDMLDVACRGLLEHVRGELA